MWCRSGDERDVGRLKSAGSLWRFANIETDMVALTDVLQLDATSSRGAVAD